MTRTSTTPTRTDRGRRARRHGRLGQPGGRTRRVGPVVLAVAGLVALGACGSEGDAVATDTALDSTSVPTTAGPGDAPCADDSWTTVDAGDFSFTLPADAVDQEPQGVDSQVGRYVGGGLTVEYDYGWYSPNFDDLAADGTRVDVALDGRPAHRLTTDAADTLGYEQAHLTALYVPPPTGGTVGGSALALWVTFDDDALAATADCIVDSVSFG